MEDDFYKGRLTDKHSLSVLLPTEEQRETVHRVIYEELCLGQIRQPSKRQYMEIMELLIDRGAEGIILGCTEIGLLVSAEDTRVPVFDTTRIHALAAVSYALEPRRRV
jgi:aspartate racemase